MFKGYQMMTNIARNQTINTVEQGTPLINEMVSYIAPTSSDDQTTVVVRDLDGVDMLLEKQTDWRIVFEDALRLMRQTNRLQKQYEYIPVIAVTNGILGLTPDGYHPNGYLAAIQRSEVDVNEYVYPVVSGSSAYYNGSTVQSIFLNQTQQEQIAEIIEAVKDYLQLHVDGAVGQFLLRDPSAAGLMGEPLLGNYGTALIHGVSVLMQKQLHEKKLSDLLSLHHTPSGDNDSWVRETTDVQMVCKSVKALGSLYAINQVVASKLAIWPVDALLAAKSKSWLDLVQMDYEAIEAFAKEAFQGLNLKIIAIGDTFKVTPEGKADGSDKFLFGLARALDPNAIIVQPNSMEIVGKGYFRPSYFNESGTTAPIDHPWCPTYLVNDVPLMAQIFGEVANRLESVA